MAKSRNQSSPSTRQAKTAPQRRSPLGRIWRWLWRLVWAVTWRLSALGLVVGLIFLGIMWNLTPDVRDLSPRERDQTVRFFAGDGETLIGTSSIVSGDPITADRIPENLATALIASEDRRFYWHPGLDPEGLARAMYYNLRNRSFSQGGSSITQQLAKLRYLSNERTLWRKIQEAVLALKLEWHHDKNEILAAYMNEVFVGQRVYGFSGAAERFFNASVYELTDYQAIVLAGIIQAPSRQNPVTSQENAVRRARLVIGAMEDTGDLTAEEAEAFRSLSPNLLPPQVIDGNNPDLTYFTDWVWRTLNDQGAEILLTHGEILGQDMDVITTLDLTLQKQAAAKARNMILTRGVAANARQVGAVVMDRRGAVLAMVGGTDYLANNTNHALAQRQPGSTFKLFVYLAAMMRGADHQSLIADVPRSHEGWSPQNYDGRSHGTVTLIEAFSKSYNMAAANLSEATGRNRVRALAAELMGREVGSIPAVPSIALGSAEASLLEMTAAYGAVSTGGSRLRPFGIRRVVFENGDQFSFETPPVSSSLSGNTQAVGSMNLMLREVTRAGTGRRARIDDYTFGKTGTTDAYRDAWFVGFQNSPVLGNLVAGVWVGNSDNERMDRVSGGTLPAELWREIVSIGSPLGSPYTDLNLGENGPEVIEGTPATFAEPDGMVVF